MKTYEVMKESLTWVVGSAQRFSLLLFNVGISDWFRRTKRNLLKFYCLWLYGSMPNFSTLAYKLSQLEHGMLLLLCPLFLEL